MASSCALAAFVALVSAPFCAGVFLAAAPGPAGAAAVATGAAGAAGAASVFVDVSSFTMINF